MTAELAVLARSWAKAKGRRGRKLFAHVAAENADLLVRAVALHQCGGPDRRQTSVASFDEISERDHDAGS